MERYAWNWAVLVTKPYAGWILLGLMWTLLVSLASWAIALARGSVVGVARTLPGHLPRALAAAYVEVFRNVPLLVQLFVWYFVVPELLPADWGRWLKRDLHLAE